MSEIRIGYLPLTDAAVVVAAAERGFAERHGLTITLAREASWATLRDRLALGHVDAAHILAPLAVATTLGLGPGPRMSLAVPFVLNLNGNAITVSSALWREMGEPAGGLADVQAAFGRAARERAGAGRPLILATTFPYSTHTYLLRRFLAGAGLDPDADVSLTVIPPPYQARALAEGTVDGFCVGAPWNSVAVSAGAGRIAALGTDLVADAPEKVLAMPAGRLPDDAVATLVAALTEAAEWCAEPANRAELAALLAEPRHLGFEASVIERTLSGRMMLGPEGPESDDPAYLRLGGDLHRPDPSIADWILGEMEASGQAAPDDAMRRAARAMFERSS